MHDVDAGTRVAGPHEIASIAIFLDAKGVLCRGGCLGVRCGACLNTDMPRDAHGGIGRVGTWNTALVAVSIERGDLKSCFCGRRECAYARAIS
eukprot:scaffold54086_cov27-Tisochrysis_lutea.AAC.4